MSESKRKNKGRGREGQNESKRVERWKEGKGEISGKSYSKGEKVSEGEGEKAEGRESERGKGGKSEAERRKQLRLPCKLH